MRAVGNVVVQQERTFMPERGVSICMTDLNRTMNQPWGCDLTFTPAAIAAAKGANNCRVVVDHTTDTISRVINDYEVVIASATEPAILWLSASIDRSGISFSGYWIRREGRDGCGISAVFPNRQNEGQIALAMPKPGLVWISRNGERSFHVLKRASRQQQPLWKYARRWDYDGIVNLSTRGEEGRKLISAACNGDTLKTIERSLSGELGLYTYHIFSRPDGDVKILSDEGFNNLPNKTYGPADTGTRTVVVRGELDDSNYGLFSYADKKKPRYPTGICGEGIVSIGDALLIIQRNQHQPNGGTKNSLILVPDIPGLEN